MQKGTHGAVRLDTTSGGRWGEEPTLSFVLPAKNEVDGLRSFLPELRSRFPEAEIIVVDDGSTDSTAAVARSSGARVVRHPHSLGNGAAVKAGARAARGDILFFMDADGQHSPESIDVVLTKMSEGFDMVVGARDATSQASRLRLLANVTYNAFASYMVGRRIDDLTSGFRAARRRPFQRIMHLLPNTFSYPTTSTMAFFRAGYTVAYVPIKVKRRIGRSHIKLFQDGIRFLLIIFKIGTLYSPLRLFFPASLAFMTTGLGYYAYSYLSFGRFTNMGLLLMLVSVLIFLIGLVAEQITMISYQGTERGD